MKCQECADLAELGMRMTVHRSNGDGLIVPVTVIKLGVCKNCVDRTWRKWGSNQMVQFTILSLNEGGFELISGEKQTQLEF